MNEAKYRAENAAVEFLDDIAECSDKDYAKALFSVLLTGVRTLKERGETITAALNKIQTLIRGVK